MGRSRRGYLVLSAVAACLFAAVSGCSDGPAALVFPGSQTGGIDLSPGQVAVFSAVLATQTPATIVLVSAALIPLPGYATPRLVHLALLHPPTGDMPAATSGWPPANPPHGTWSLLPFAGAKVTTVTSSESTPIVLYGVSSGSVAGRVLAAGGLEVTYRLGGAQYQATSYGGGEVCVVPDAAHESAKQTAACTASFNKVALAEGVLTGSTVPSS